MKRKTLKRIDFFGRWLLVFPKLRPIGRILFIFGFLLFCSNSTARADLVYEFQRSWGSQGTGDSQFGGEIRHLEVDIDPGNIYVSDNANNRIQIFDPNGNFLAKRGGPGSGQVEFNNLDGIALDGSYNIYAADSGNCRIQKLSPYGPSGIAYLTEWVPDNHCQGPNVWNSVPHDVAVDWRAKVYVATGWPDCLISKFNDDGSFIMSYYGIGNFCPESITINRDGDVYAIFENTIQRFNSEGNFMMSWTVGGSGDELDANVWDIAIGRDKAVYVTENDLSGPSYSRIVKYDENGNFLTAWYPLGGLPSSTVMLEGIAVDVFGVVYVADVSNHLIEQYFPIDLSALDHIVLSPSSTTISEEGTQTYTATAYDVSNSALGKVTNSTTFSISPDGSCSGAVCTATVLGPHTVTGDYYGKTATANLQVTAITLDFLPPEYSSCGNVSINGVVLTSSGTITRLSWDWGDGVVADSWFPAAHRYQASGSYTVTVTAFSSTGDTWSNSSSVDITNAEDPLCSVSLLTPTYLNCGNVSINGCVGTGSCINCAVTHFSWDWDDGIVADSWFPATHRYLANGSYTVTVTAYCSTGETQSSSTTVSITNAEDPLCNYGLFVYPTPVILRGGKTSETLRVELRDADGVPVSLSDKNVSFSSSNPAIVQVDASGVVSSTGFGETQITVTVEGFPLSANASVFAGEFRIEPPIMLLATNGQPTGQLNLKVTNADGSLLNLTGRTVTFHGSNAVAQVNGSGLVTALRPPQSFNETPSINADIDGLWSHNAAVIRVTSDPLNLNMIALQEPNIIFYIAQQIGSFNYQQIFQDFDVPRITNIAYQLEEEVCGLVPFQGDMQYFVNDPGHGQDGTVPCGVSGNPLRLGTDVDKADNNSCLIVASSPATPQWGVFFHEMAHNFTLASRSFSEFVNSSDVGNSNTTYIQGLATAVSMYVGQVTNERATQYQIPANVSSTVISSVWHFGSTPDLDAYVNNGANYSTINPNVLDDIISVVADKYGYSLLPKFFSVFLPPDASYGSFGLNNSDVSQATFFIAAMSASTGSDLRSDFCGKWGFPIDDLSFNQLYTQLKRVVAQRVPETIPPTGTISINGGATVTNSTSVTLALTESDDSGGFVQMCISNTTACTTFEALAATRSWTLTTGDGTKTVYVWYRDVWGNTNALPYSASIILDTTAPTNGTVTATPGNAQVTLIWTGFSDALSGIANYVVRYATGSAPTSCTAGTAAPGYDGTSTAYIHKGLVNGTTYGYRVCATDGVGNMSSGATASAKPADTLPPTGTMTINGGAVATKSTTVTLTLTASDDSPGAIQMCVSNTASCTTFSAFAATKSWTLTTGQGKKTVYVRYRDVWGNTNAVPYSASIILDTAAPTNGTVTATSGNTQVTLNWNGFTDIVTGIAGYKVVYATGSAPTSCSRGTMIYSGTDTSYIHKGLTNGTTYGYRVCASDWVGDMCTGATASAKPVPETNPPAGSITINGGAVATKSTTVTLALTASDDSPGAIQMCISNTTNCTTFSAFAATKSWTLTTGQGKKTVNVWYRDVWGNTNAVPYSASIILDTAAPTNGTVTATPGNTQVTLQWSGFTDTVTGIAGYKVVYATGTPPTSCSTGTMIYSGTDTSYIHKGLTNGTTYGYRVCATDWVGDMSTGATASARPVPETNPPTGSITINGGAVATKSTTATLTLTASDDSPGAIQMCISNTTSCTTFSAFAATKSWTLTTGQGKKTVNVWYRDVWGNTNALPYSASIILDTTAPTNGTVTATPGDTQVTLHWTGFTDIGSGIGGYVVRYAVSSAPTSCTAGTAVPGYDGTSPTCVHSGLTNGTTYGYRVCATDKAGNMSTGATATAKPADTLPPTGTMTINGGAAATNSTAVTLTLSATDTSGVSQMCVSNTTSCTLWVTYATSMPWTLTTGDGTKTVYIWFRDVLGNTDALPYSTSIILDTTAPTDGTVTALAGNTQVTLNWSGFSDALSGMAGYAVRYAVGSAPSSCATGTAVPGYDGTSATYTHTGLTNGTTYGYRVCAIDKAGNMSTGATASAKLTVEASAIIGIAGGIVEVTNPASPLLGVKVDIPPGALSQSVTITISSVSQLPPAPTGLQPSGPYVEFGPNGLQFNQPISITLPSSSNDFPNDSDLTFNYIANNFSIVPNQDPWAEGSSQKLDFVNNRITSIINHFSAYQNLSDPEIKSKIDNASSESITKINYDDSVCTNLTTRTNPIANIVIHSTDDTLNLSRHATRIKYGETCLFATYYVDSCGRILQVADDTIQTNHTYTFNTGSIGIEMLDLIDEKCDDGTGTYSKLQVDALISLTRQLMEEYDISADNVYRHYDIAQQIDCNNWVTYPNPRPFQDQESCEKYKTSKEDPMAWTDAQFNAFKALLQQPPACIYTCSAWGGCQPDGKQTCMNISSSPVGCVGTPPAQLTQPCTLQPPSSTLFILGQVVDGCFDTFTNSGFIDAETLLAEGGTPTTGYTWSIAPGYSFPPGVTVDPSTGIIKSNGANPVPGLYTISMQVSDGLATATGSIWLEVSTASSAPVNGIPGVGCGAADFQQGWNDVPLPDAKVGYAYGASLSVIEGIATLPIKWSLATGALPPGLAISPNTGVIVGVVSAGAARSTPYSFTINVIDNGGYPATCPFADICPTYTINVPE